MNTPASTECATEIDFEELYDHIQKRVIVGFDFSQEVIRVDKQVLIDLCAHLQQRRHRDDRTKALIEQVRSLEHALDKPYEKANWGVLVRVESAVEAPSPIVAAVQTTAADIHTVVAAPHNKAEEVVPNASLPTTATKHTKTRRAAKETHVVEESLFDTMLHISSWAPDFVPNDVKHMLRTHVNALENDTADASDIFAKLQKIVEQYRIHPRFISSLEHLHSIRKTIAITPEDE